MTFAPAPETVPVVVTSDLAAALGLEVGGRFGHHPRPLGEAAPGDLHHRHRPGDPRHGLRLPPPSSPSGPATLVLLAQTGSAGDPPPSCGRPATAHAPQVVAALPLAAVRDAADTGTFTEALVLALVDRGRGDRAPRRGGPLRSRDGPRPAAGDGCLRPPRARHARGAPSASRAGELIAVAAGALAAGALLGVLLALFAVPALTRVAVVGVPEALSGGSGPAPVPLALTVVLARA